MYIIVTHIKSKKTLQKAFFAFSFHEWFALLQNYRLFFPIRKLLYPHYSRTRRQITHAYIYNTSNKVMFYTSTIDSTVLQFWFCEVQLLIKLRRNMYNRIHLPPFYRCICNLSKPIKFLYSTSPQFAARMMFDIARATNKEQRKRVSNRFSSTLSVWLLPFFCQIRTCHVQSTNVLTILFSCPYMFRIQRLAIVIFGFSMPLHKYQTQNRLIAYYFNKLRHSTPLYAQI